MSLLSAHLPLVTVIVANYNNGEFLKECLDSIFHQTYQTLEIVICDDASTDDSPHIIRAYAENYPKTVRTVFLPINRGPAAARHEAIRHARGQYLTTLDSDDIFSNPRKIEKEMELVRYHKERFNRDICAFSDTLILDRQLNIIKRAITPGKLLEGDIFIELLTRSCFVPRDMVFPTDAYWAVGGYDSQFRIREDWDLKIRLARNYHFYYTGDTGTGYRKQGRGLSASSLNRNPVLWLENVFQKNLLLAPEADRSELIRRFQAFIRAKS